MKYTAVLLMTVMLMVSGCGKSEAKKPAQKPVPKVKVKILKPEPHTIWVEYNSKAEAYETATVTSRVEGELLKQMFKAGAYVHDGQVLFEIDKRDYKADYNRALAQLEKDEASLEFAQADVRRYAPLVKEKLAPKQKLEQLEAARKELEATVKSDKVLIEDAKLKLSYCDVEAPIDGKIGKEFVKPGNMVTPGKSLASIVDGRALQVNFFPTTREVAEIQKYKSKPFPDVEIYLRDNPAIVLKGEVEFIASRADETTDTVAMRAKVANKEEVILPGSFVTVRLIIHRNMPVIAISPDWVFQDQEGEFIYTVDNNNTLQKVHFLSPFSNTQIVILPDSLANKKVLVQPAGNLVEGSHVEPILMQPKTEKGA